MDNLSVIPTKLGHQLFLDIRSLRHQPLWTIYIDVYGDGQVVCEQTHEPRFVVFGYCLLLHVPSWKCLAYCTGSIIGGGFLVLSLRWSSEVRDRRRREESDDHGLTQLHHLPRKHRWTLGMGRDF